MIGERIQELMDERGWNQRDLVVNMSEDEGDQKRLQTLVSRWQNGVHTPNADGLILLARAFGVPIEELLN